MNIDLHIHSDFSDGLYKPSEIITYAINGNLDVISITDHDTFHGVKEAINNLENNKIKIIPGIEISCFIDDEEIHILGYNIDLNNVELNEYIIKAIKKREIRGKEILYKLKKYGIDLDYEELIENHKYSFIGRSNIATEMVTKNFVETKYEAFSKYLGKGKVAYSPLNLITVQEAINLIKNASGLAIFAHPTLEQFKNYLSYFKKIGLDGIEIYRPLRPIEETVYMEFIAVNMKMMVTGGSDWHGDKENSLLGDFYISENKITKIW